MRRVLGHQVRGLRLAAFAALAALSVLASTTLPPGSAAGAESTMQVSLAVNVTPDAPPEGVAWGSTVLYQIAVTNTGTAGISDITVDDTLCGHVGDVAALAPGETSSLLGRADLTGSGDGQTTVRGVGPGGGEVSAAAAHSVLVFFADDFYDYAVTKTPSRQTAAAGDEVSYTIRITGVSAPAASSARLKVVDTYDPAFAVLGDAGVAGAQTSPGRIVWVVDAPLVGDDPVTLTYSLRVADDAAVGSTVRNTVAVSVEGDQFDVEPTDNVASASVDVVARSAGRSGAPGQSRQVTGGEPFLPFTGMPEVALIVAFACAVVGAALRAYGRTD